MPTNQAVLADVSRRMLRSLTDAETVFVPTALEDAFRQIIIELPDVRALLDSIDLPDSDPYRQLVIAVQCAMVIRVLENPDGVLEETTDDYTRRLDAARSTGLLALTDTERGLLGAGTGQAEGAFSVRAMPERPAIWDYFPTTSTDTWPPGALRYGRIW